MPARSQLGEYNVSLPVCLTRRNPDDSVELVGEVIGTCFGLSRDLVLTAGHVAERIQAVQQDAIVPIFEPARLIPHPAQVVETEILGADVALLRLNFAEF